MEIGRVGVIAHPEVKKELLLSIKNKLSKKGLKLFYDPLCAKKIGQKPTEIKDMDIDLAIICGGDGTMLWSAGKLKGSPLLLGVNTGRVGFLNEVSIKNVSSSIDRILKNDYHVDERSRLRVNKRFDVLNELAILPQKPASLLEFSIKVGGEQAVSFRADGVLISTQTGSTGHALSAGGPIIHPDAKVYLITPMISFMQAQPAMIVPDTSKTEIEVISKKSDIYLVLDGNVIKKHAHTDKVSVEKSPKGARFIRFTKKRWKMRTTGSGSLN